MTLPAEAVALLEGRGSPHAMIGAAAMAVLGASRPTQDLRDVEQVLAITPDRGTVTARLEERVKDLPPRCGRLWHRIADRKSG